MLARMAAWMGGVAHRVSGVQMSQERMDVGAAQRSLPQAPVRELDRLGFKPTATARFDTATGPLLYLCDGRHTVVELAAQGPVRLRFWSVAEDGQLLETGEVVAPRTALGPGIDHAGANESVSALWAAHQEHVEGEKLLSLDDRDLHAGLGPYRDRLQSRGPAAALVGVVALSISSIVLLGVGVAMSPVSGWAFTVGVVLGIVVVPFLGWAEYQLGIAPGLSLGRVLVPRGLLDREGLRALASDEQGAKQKRRAEPSLARRLEDLGFEPAEQAQVRRRGRFGRVQVYDVTTLVAEGTLAAHLSMRDGPKKPRVVLQSLFSDTIIETVVGGGLGSVVFGDTYDSRDVDDLEAAVSEHWERAAERWPVQVDERKGLLVGLARFVEIARGEEAREHGRFAIRIVLIVLALPLLVGFAVTPDGETAMGVVGLAAIALDWLMPGVVAEVGLLVGAQQREISPAELQAIGRESLELDKPKPLWRRLLGGS
ncbi:MAG: hypothetical protein KC912_13920 [Proteobacteria bacterium]|nr:hypothetical protein [Pseudomonadota bacterium]